MEFISTATGDVKEQMTLITDSEKTTTLPSGAKPFTDWKESVSEPSGFTGPALVSPIIIEEMSSEAMERFITEWEASLASPTRECLVFTTTDTSRMSNSSNGSTGPSPVEAEP